MGEHTAILFDLDETLVRQPNDGDERLQDAFDEVGAEPFFDHDDFEQWVPYVEGENDLDLRIKCFNEIAREMGKSPSTAEAVARAYDRPPGEAFEPIADAANVVSLLKKKGYLVGLVTNGSERRQRTKLRLLGLEDSFDAMYFGTPETGLKPDPRPFEVVLAELGVTPDEAVKIGDLLDVDIAPANTLGMTTVWFPTDRTRQSPVPDVTINHLPELVSEPWADVASR